jgi:hypothetical protein
MTDTPGSGTSYQDPSDTDTGKTEPTGQSGQTGQGGREWVTQLQSMIDNVTTAAGPVVRDVAAKAAELAAIAGEKAGPIAHKAAEATEAAGHKLAERGREVAAELRRDKEAGNGHAPDAGAAAGDTPNAIAPAPASTATGERTQDPEA